MYDDAVGLHAARLIRPRITAFADVLESSASGLDLLELTEGYPCALILDALTLDYPPGTIVVFGLDDFRLPSSVSPHWLSISDAWDTARILGLPVADEIIGLGMQVTDTGWIREGLNPEVQEGLTRFASEAVGIVEFLVNNRWSSKEGLGRYAPKIPLCG
ncbi:MAG: hydrogenase maturation protease [Bacteroidetes bacterium]|nr:hydrogenase maturation protease [Bacteroidota bacterium]